MVAIQPVFVIPLNMPKSQKTKCPYIKDETPSHALVSDSRTQLNHPTYLQISMNKYVTGYAFGLMS